MPDNNLESHLLQQATRTCRHHPLLSGMGALAAVATESETTDPQPHRELGYSSVEEIMTL